VSCPCGGNTKGGDGCRNRWLVRIKHDGHWYFGGRYVSLLYADQQAKALRNKLFTHNIEDRKKDAA
jgi:hypothetical protein